MKFKIDQHKKIRGKHSRLLDLSCRVCGKKIIIYQKDGPGNIRRLYFDRIFFPKRLTKLESKSLNSISSLRCPKCREDIGTPYIYKKENRKAFKVYQDALVRKVRRLK